MSAASNLLARDLGKPPLHLVDPRRGSWREARMEARMTRKPTFHRKGLVCAVLIHHDVDVGLIWEAVIEYCQEFENLRVTMTTVQLPDQLSGRNIQGRKQRGRAMALGVMGASLGRPGVMGRIGCVRSSAWIWLFSSTQSTTALVGGARYSPTMSRTLSTNSASVETLKLSADVAASRRRARCAIPTTATVSICLPRHACSSVSHP